MVIGGRFKEAYEYSHNYQNCETLGRLLLELQYLLLLPKVKEQEEGTIVKIYDIICKLRISYIQLEVPLKEWVFIKTSLNKEEIIEKVLGELKNIKETGDLPKEEEDFKLFNNSKNEEDEEKRVKKKKRERVVSKNKDFNILDLFMLKKRKISLNLIAFACKVKKYKRDFKTGSRITKIFQKGKSFVALTMGEIFLYNFDDNGFNKYVEQEKFPKGAIKYFMFSVTDSRRYINVSFGENKVSLYEVNEKEKKGARIKCLKEDYKINGNEIIGMRIVERNNNFHLGVLRNGSVVVFSLFGKGKQKVIRKAGSTLISFKGGKVYPPFDENYVTTYCSTIDKEKILSVYKIKTKIIKDGEQDLCFQSEVMFEINLEKEGINGKSSYFLKNLILCVTSNRELVFINILEKRIIKRIKLKNVIVDLVEGKFESEKEYYFIVEKTGTIMRINPRTWKEEYIAVLKLKGDDIPVTLAHENGALLLGTKKGLVYHIVPFVNK